MELNGKVLNDMEKLCNEGFRLKINKSQPKITENSRNGAGDSLSIKIESDSILKLN